MRFFTALSLCSFFAMISGAVAQTTNALATIRAAGYSVPTRLAVAPGQLITLFVPSAGISLNAPVVAPAGPLPTSLAGFSAIFRQNLDMPMPILMVRQISTCSTGLPPPPPGGPRVDSCGSTIAVTVQIPFEILTLCPVCGRIQPPSRLAVGINGSVGPFVDVTPVSEQVHILTSCDVIVTVTTGFSLTGLPCPQLVTHADGTPVSPRSPAKGGEALVAYATGLGQTNPPLASGQPAMAAASAQTEFGVDVNYHANALATKPGARSPWLLPAAAVFYAGATPGFPGLYQINFIVPPPPDGLSPCADWTTMPPGTNVTQTNLTVSIGSVYSFDGVAICVQPK